MIFLQNDENFEFDENLLQQIAKKNSKKDIELLIINDTDMQKLNLKARGIDKSTDVLSFPLELIENAPLGSIVINKDKVIEISNQLSHSHNEETALLFIHGLLHLLGYDHENDNGEMREKEKEIIEDFNLPKSLIIRVEK